MWRMFKSGYDLSPNYANQITNLEEILKGTTGCFNSICVKCTFKLYEQYLYIHEMRAFIPTSSIFIEFMLRSHVTFV